MEELKSRMSALETKVAAHDSRLVQQEERLRLYAETKYVDGLLKPLETAITKFQGAFEHINDKLETLATGQDTLNTTYNQLLRDRGERENREHEKKIEILEVQLRTANDRGVIKSLRENATPVLAFLVALATIVAIVLAMIKAYVLNVPK
jgi:chromosome segregation ATPase